VCLHGIINQTALCIFMSFTYFAFFTSFAFLFPPMAAA
jgi:hypothetical protein